MSELIPVNIVIADRTYRIKTRPEDEEVIRKTVKMINDKLFEFKAQFAGKDMQDYIAMVIIWYATENVGGDGNSMLNKEMVNALMKMEKQLDEKLEA
jgi:cell division protein ZapA (FtsZ GTPase activity inhibitor)